MPLQKNNSGSVLDLATLDHFPLPVILYNEKQVFFANKEAIKFFKIKRNSKTSIFQFFPKNRHQQVKDTINKILKGSNIPIIEMSILDNKGSSIYVEAKSNRVVFEGKKVIQTTFIEIEKRITLLKSLKKSSNILSSLGSYSDEVIFELSYFPKPAITYISNSVKRILGKTPEQVYNNLNIFMKNIHPDDLHQYTNSLKDYVKVHGTKEPAKANFRFYKSKNEIVHIQGISHPVFNAKKELIGIIGTLKDITTQYKTEKLLQEAKQKFDLITSNGNDVIAFYTYYPEEKYLYVSPNIEKLMGCKESELLKDYSFFSKRSKDFKSEFDKIDEKLKYNQKHNIIKNLTYVYKTIHKNGKEIWLENNLTPILDDKGKISFYLNLYRDITIQKQRELDLQQQKENLESLLDSSPVAYFIHNKGQILYCNNALLKILKVKTKEKVLGVKNYEFLTPQSRKKAIERTKLLYTDTKFNTPETYFLCDTKKNTIEVEISSNLQKYNNELCIVSMVTNITKQKEIDRNKLKLELSQQNNKALEQQIIEKTKIQKLLTEKSALLSSILENLDHLIWTVDEFYNLTSFNKNFYKLVSNKYKIKFKEGENIAVKIADTKIRKEYIDFWSTIYNKSFKGEKQVFFRGEITSKKNDVYYKVFVNPIFNEQNKVVKLSCIADDVTQEKIYEQKLINQTAKLSAVIESGNQLVWTVNRNLELTSYNKNYYSFVKDNLKEGTTLNRKVNVLSTVKSDELKVFWKNKYLNVLNGNQQIFTHKSFVNGKSIYREIFLHPVYFENEIIEVSAIAHDITERIANEQKILNQAAKLNSIIDSSHHYIWTIDRNQTLTSFNKNYFQLIESIYQTKPYIGLKLNLGILRADKDYNDTLIAQYQKAFSGQSAHFELETQDVNHNTVHLEVFLNPIIGKESSEINEVSGIAHDITEKKISQQKIEQSLKEKEVLLKEVHHRVKNNMQVVSSILNLQSSYLSDPYALSVLKESQNRIKTMSYIHESLYQNKTFTSVNFSEYLNTLTNNIIQSYSINETKIKLILEIVKISLSLDNAIPTGLIVNELLSNAIKHAFPGDRKGTITVSLKQELNVISLYITDNGIGFSDHIDFHNSPSLGLQLVNSLIEQISGTIKFSSKKDLGTNVFITFKI
ncbi:MAG: PAS domain S-box protein [Bacteroidetes bacterium]|nr:PAS domain S-box protein [Bacteroidota bacterium]